MLSAFLQMRLDAPEFLLQRGQLLHFYPNVWGCNEMFHNFCWRQGIFSKKSRVSRNVLIINCRISSRRGVWEAKRGEVLSKGSSTTFRGVRLDVRSFLVQQGKMMSTTISKDLGFGAQCVHASPLGDRKGRFFSLRHQLRHLPLGVDGETPPLLK